MIEIVVIVILLLVILYMSFVIYRNKQIIVHEPKYVRIIEKTSKVYRIKQQREVSLEEIDSFNNEEEFRKLIKEDMIMCLMNKIPDEMFSVTELKSNTKPSIYFEVELEIIEPFKNN